MTFAKKRAEKIAEAQLNPTCKLAGKTYGRIRYGDESEDWGGGTCGGCHVKVGQYHVPGCDIERCPKCGRQAISCSCTKASIC